VFPAQVDPYSAAKYVALVSLVIIVAWVIWGVREYRRTGRTVWLWMAAVMAIGLGSTIAGVMR
jgi:hypothetical protein